MGHESNENGAWEGNRANGSDIHEGRYPAVLTVFPFLVETICSFRIPKLVRDIFTSFL